MISFSMQSSTFSTQSRKGKGLLIHVLVYFYPI